MLHDLERLLECAQDSGCHAVTCERTGPTTLLVSTRNGHAIGVWRATPVGLELTLVAYGLPTHSTSTATAAAEITRRAVAELTERL